MGSKSASKLIFASFWCDTSDNSDTSVCRSSKSATGRVGFEWPTISVVFCQRIPVTIVPRTESHD